MNVISTAQKDEALVAAEPAEQSISAAQIAIHGVVERGESVSSAVVEAALAM